MKSMQLAGSEDEDPMDDDQRNESEFAHESELREEAEHQPLGGVDVDRCGRLSG
jgi:hypothetical protein